jgi:hypothetical protein
MSNVSIKVKDISGVLLCGCTQLQDLEGYRHSEGSTVVEHLANQRV